MREFTLNMLSHADRVKGQGVLSAYLEGTPFDYRKSGPN